MEPPSKISYNVDRVFVCNFGGNMDFLEYLYYESLPYLYGTVAAFALMNHEASKIAGVAGIILAFCSYKVFYKRFYYRTYSKKYNHQIRL